MTTGMTIGVVGIAAAGLAIAAMAVMRALAPQRSSETLPVPPSLADSDEPSLPPPRSERSARPSTHLRDPSATDPDVPSPAAQHKGFPSPPTIPPSETYDPTLENEDDVPTTLFRDSDAEEIDALIAEMDSDGGER